MTEKQKELLIILMNMAIVPNAARHMAGEDMHECISAIVSIARDIGLTKNEIRCGLRTLEKQLGYHSGVLFEFIELN